MKKDNPGKKINPAIIPAFVLRVISRINAAGFNAYLVGGAIRDMLIGRQVVDWDIATSASRDEITSLFNDIRHFSLKHETVSLVYKGRHYEVTTIKGNDIKSPAIEDDLGHRDFTINAMAYDPEKGTIIDPYNGYKDLKKRTVRAVKDPCERFVEDPLRLIRAVRISVELRFGIDRLTMRGIVDMSPRLSLSAGERIREELMKILLVDRPSSGFRLLKNSGLLNVFLPELMEGLSIRQNVHHRHTVYRHIMETMDRVEPDPVLRLAALFHDIAKPRVRQKIKGRFRFYGHAEESASLAREIMCRLRFSNEMTGKVVCLISNHMVEYDGNWSDGAVRRLIRRLEPYPIERFLSLRRADLLAHGTSDREIELLSDLERRVSVLKGKRHAIHIRDLALKGEKVMVILGLPPGPEVGKALEFMLESVTDRPELNTEESLTMLLRNWRP